MNSHHVDNMLRQLHRFGMSENETRPDAWVLGKELTDQGEKIKLQAWTCESLLFACREIALDERCDWKAVVRCYGQAREYRGRTGGFAVSCYVNDAISYVQTRLEDRVSL